MRATTSLLLSVLLAAVCSSAAAAPPPKAAPKAKAKAKSTPLTALEDQIKDTQRQVDQELLRLFSDQVQTGVYRSRLGILQREWQKLFAETGPKPKRRTYPVPAPGEFAIDAAVGSDRESLDDALGNAVCKKKRGCRIWARISFGKELVKKGSRFEYSAEIWIKGSSNKVAMPAKEMAIAGPSQIVDISLDGVYISKGSYEGTLKVIFGERIKSKPLAFELIEVY